MATIEIFKKKTFDEKIKASKELRDKYPDRVPVIVEGDKIELEKFKFLLPENSTMGEFMNNIRNIHVKEGMNSTEAMFFYINKKIISIPSMTASEVYNNYKDEDGFLYIYITKQDTFG